MKYATVLLAVVAAVYAEGDAPLCATTDAIFIIDSSQSITKHQFDNIKLYASNFLDMFDIGTGQGQAQFGGVVFNEDVRTQWNLNSYTTSQDLKAFLSQLPYITGTTNTGTAFTKARDILTSQGARPTSCRGIVLFTDGRYDHGDNPIPLAQKLRDELNAKVISVAVEGINGFLAPYDYDMLVELSGDKNLVFVLPNVANNMEEQHRMKRALLTPIVPIQ
jgi:hypothetical protein